MKKIGIYVKRGAPEAGAVAKELIDWLKTNGCTALFDEEFTSEYGVAGGLPPETVIRDCELLVVLGGDGTFLAAGVAAADEEKPILGVNLGGLGFLTETPLSEMYKMLELVIEDKIEYQYRNLFDVEVICNGQSEKYQVLNDAVVGKAALARIINIKISIEGRLVTHLLADGIIVSTPTGSTAYSMAAGGPICHPLVETIILTPICPHLLAARPLLVPGSSRLCIELISGGRCYYTLDGQFGKEFHVGDKLYIEKSQKPLKMVCNPHRSYYQTLRNKLRWGRR